MVIVQNRISFAVRYPVTDDGGDKERTTNITSKSANDVCPLVGEPLNNCIVDTKSHQTKCTTFRQYIGVVLHRECVAIDY